MCNSCANVIAKGKSPKPSKEELQALINQGLQIKQIEELYGRTDSTVHYWLKQYDIQSKSYMRKKIYCVELDKSFESLIDAAKYLVENNFSSATKLGALGNEISKAAKYGYIYAGFHWKT